MKVQTLQLYKSLTKDIVIGLSKYVLNQEIHCLYGRIQANALAMLILGDMKTILDSTIINDQLILNNKPLEKDYFTTAFLHVKAFEKYLFDQNITIPNYEFFKPEPEEKLLKVITKNIIALPYQRIYPNAVNLKKYQLLSVAINGIIQDKNDYTFDNNNITYTGELNIKENDNITFQYILR